MKRQIAFTLRFDPMLYERVKEVSDRVGRSVTSFVQEAVARKLQEEDTAALFHAFTLVGEDFEESNVEFACDAQREAALKDA
jgi:predicted transcriptional regulator